MTQTNPANLIDLINQAQSGQYVYCYPKDSLARQSALTCWHHDYRCMLRTLFAGWPETGTKIRAASFVFTDAPYALSRFVIDAVVVWDGDAFRRVELADMPAGFRTTVEMFEESVQMAIGGKVGDAVAAMAEKYSHQLLSGQGYLTLDTLTVMNIRGSNTSRCKALLPNLPYAVTALLTGTAREIVERYPESGKPCGSLWLADWTTGQNSQSRISEKYLKTCSKNTSCPIFDNPEELREFQEAAHSVHEQAKRDGCRAI